VTSVAAAPASSGEAARADAVASVAAARIADVTPSADATSRLATGDRALIRAAIGIR
jgi:hypothetical protein